MSYTIGRFPYEPIVLVTYDPRFFDFQKDPHEIAERLADIAANSSERLCLIHDLHGFGVNFSAAVDVLALAFQAWPASEGLDQSDNIIIGGADIIKLVPRGNGQAQLGGFEIAHFESIGSALLDTCGGLC